MVGSARSWGPDNRGWRVWFGGKVVGGSGLSRTGCTSEFDDEVMAAAARELWLDHLAQEADDGPDGW